MDVVVTGVGAVAGHAASAASLFDCLHAGESMVREHPRYRDYGFRQPAMAYLSPEVWQRVDRTLGEVPPGWGTAARLGVYAARQALHDSGLATRPQAVRRGGVFVGNNKSTFDETQYALLSGYYDSTTQRLDFDAFMAADVHPHNSYHCKHQDTTAVALAADLGWQDCISTHGDACAAGGMAIGSAYRRIRAGELDVAMAGGSEAMGNFATLAAFTAVGTLASESTLPPAELSRPFDARRSGFVMGEGSAFLVLEAGDHARSRGAQVLATVRGFACRLEAHRISASTESGEEFARCMTAALHDARLAPDGIDHVNAHGTSTQSNDASEALAIKRVFGARAASLPVTANKSALGHSMACSGAIEAVLSVLSLQRQALLPTLNFQRADESCQGLDIVTRPRSQALRTVLSNSFGFGGQNCALILERA